MLLSQVLFFSMSYWALSGLYYIDGITFEFDKAESIALTYKSKIGNDMSWRDSSVYLYIMSKPDIFVNSSDDNTAASTNDFITQIQDMIDEGNLADADKKLKRFKKPAGISAENFVNMYDEVFLSVIEAHWNNGDYDAAESMALSYMTKIGDGYYWRNKSIVKNYLESKFKSVGRNFDALSGW